MKKLPTLFFSRFLRYNIRMKNKTFTWIFFFLFALTASGAFAAFSENSRQGLLAISVTSQPAFNLENPEQHQGLTCVLLNLVSVGAFTSKDPISFSGGYNLYRYADNNPIRWVDPWGLSADDCKYKNFTLNILHVSENGRFPFDTSYINNAFRFLYEDNKVNFTIKSLLIHDYADKSDTFSDDFTNFNYYPTIIFGVYSSLDDENNAYANIILSETKFPNEKTGWFSGMIKYGQTLNKRAMVDWNNGQHLNNPSAVSFTLCHEAGHILGLIHSGGIMEQNNFSATSFDDPNSILKALEK
jgi:hypothetical protein